MPEHRAAPEPGKNFQEIVSDIADRKKRAGERFKGSSAPGESPREIYLAGCKAIADALQADGYQYVPSGQKLRRKTRNFSYEVWFQSSQLNVQGERVILWIHSYVFSPVLKKWRISANARSSSDYIAGGQIGNLVHAFSWMEWNLAAAVERGEQIAAASAAIKRLAYPYFAIFDDIPELVRRITADDIPAMDMESKVDSLLCFGSQPDVLAAAALLFQKRPEEREKFQAAFARFQAEGMPPPQRKLTAPGEVLAAAAITYGLPDLLLGAG